MEAQSALVGADGAVELAAVTGVGVHVSVVVRPDDAEGEHSFRLHHPAQDVGLLVSGIACDNGV